MKEFVEETFYSFYGVSNYAEYDTPEVKEYRQKVDMLSLLSADDLEIWVRNIGGHNNQSMTTGSFNHHPFHAGEIKEFADAVDVTNIAIYGRPILYGNSSNENFVQFLTRKSMNDINRL